MNAMTDLWTTFAIDTGQMVERSYRYCADTDRVIRKTTDHGDNSESFEAAICPVGLEWDGGEVMLPIKTVGFYSISSNPFSE